MDFESIRRCWREEAAAPPPALEEASVMRIIETRAVDLRRRVRRRLRREAANYLPILAIAVAGIIGGFTVNRALGACSVTILIGSVMATLWHAERRIEDANLDGSVREALARLVSQVDAAARAYVAVYVLLFAITAVTATGFVWWRDGAGLLFASVLACGALAVAWSVHSGRRYVEHMFRGYRGELAECLSQLDAQT